MLRDRFLSGLIFSGLLLLSACGGGGGGGSDSTPATPTPPPATPDITNQAAITRTNAKEITDAFVVASSTTDEIVTVVPSLLGPTSTIWQQPSNRQSNGNILIDFQQTCDSGTIRFSGTFAAASGIGDLTITHANCRQSSYDTTTNGIVRIHVRQTDINKSPIQFDFVYENFKETSISEPDSYVSNGSISHTQNSNENNSTTSYKMQHFPAGDYFETRDFITEHVSQANYYTQPVVANRHGVFGYSGWGYVTATTDTGNLLRTVINGANSTKLRIDLSSGDYVHLAIDSDGDNSYDAFLRTYISQLGLEYTSNNPPYFYAYGTSLSQPGSAQIPFSLYDSEQNFLSISITTVSTPGNVNANVTVDEDNSMSFVASASGDYVFAITVSDGKLSSTQQVSSHLIYGVPEVPGNRTNVTAAPGDAISINLAPPNNLGAPLTYQLDNPPPGMSVDTNGQLTWTVPAAPPYFGAAEYTTNVTINNGDTSTTFPFSVNSQSPNAMFPLVRTQIATPSRDNNLAIGDFDGDGRTEILATDNRHALYTLEISGNTYNQDWVFPFDPCPGESIIKIGRLGSAINGHEQVAVACSGQTIAIIAVGEGKILRKSRVSVASERLTPSYSSLQITDMLVSPITAGGANKIIVLLGYAYDTEQVFTILNPDDLIEEWHSDRANFGDSLSIANVDNDSHLEIVASRGRVYDATSHTLKWNYSAGFGTEVKTADLDGDGVAEIAGLSGGSQGVISIYDARLRSPVWQLSTGNFSGYCHFSLTRLSANANPSVVANDCFSSNLRTYSLINGGFVAGWSFTQAGWQATSIASGDIDNDSNLDIIWSASPIGVNGNLVAIDAATQLPKANSPPVLTTASGFGDALPITAANGDNVVAFSAFNNGLPLISLLAANTGSVSTSSNLSMSAAYNGFRLCAADVDLNGTREVLFSGYDGFIRTGIFDTSTMAGLLLNSSNSFTSTPAIACGDVNGDQYPDLIYSANNKISVYDIHNQQQIWDGFTLNDSIYQIRIADLDEDGQPEIIVLTNRDIIAYRRFNAGYIEYGRFTLPGSVYNNPTLLVDDIDGDAHVDILIGQSSFNNLTYVSRLSRQLNLVSSPTVGGSIISMIKESGSTNKLLVALIQGSNGYSTSHIAQIDAVSGSIDWRSPPLISSPSYSSLQRATAVGTLPARLTFGTNDAMYMTR